MQRTTTRGELLSCQIGTHRPMVMCLVDYLFAYAHCCCCFWRCWWGECTEGAEVSEKSNYSLVLLGSFPFFVLLWTSFWCGCLSVRPSIHPSAICYPSPMNAMILVHYFPKFLVRGWWWCLAGLENMRGFRIRSRPRSFRSLHSHNLLGLNYTAHHHLGILPPLWTHHLRRPKENSCSS